MDPPAITLTYLGNDPPPRGADQPEHIHKYYPVAQVAKREIEQRMRQAEHAPDLRHRMEAMQEQAQLRAFHGFLRCAEFDGGIRTDRDYLDLYDPDPEGYPGCDFLAVHAWFCRVGPELVGLWKNESARFMGEEKEFALGNAYDMMASGVNGENSEALRRRQRRFQGILASFFPRRSTQTVSELLSGRAIKPLLNLAGNKSLFSAWAECRVNIRPLPCVRPEDEGKRLEVQFLRFNDEDPLFLSGDSIYEASGQLATDGLEAATGSPRGTASPPRIRPGDVYVLETSDPENHPLPSRDVVNIQYHLHAIRHGLESRDTLQRLFGGPPPQDVGHPFSSSCRRDDPSFDDNLIGMAVSEGILPPEDGAKWTAAIDFANWGRRLREEAERMARLREFMPDNEEDEEAGNGEDDEYEEDEETTCVLYFVNNTRIMPVLI
ncbi:hypothetical protein PG985_012945 [Apiospora marii]|uniref:uncharacterized protein n=1 Tax=Apiospora marii TaxID=335849 RepID=UPI00312F9BE8